ncbi:tRNA-uridine aminocarboxypropyltransferase [Pseudomonas sp. CNPSo 3701]|uniref:tRNA-uridine aminocarboxypropyltransferase n=1 Tax=Pseudomonas sp. CNPSo 3701 TaxID=3027943 RepID=UPI0023632F78|nr:DTW domain-containing protein [Pseudomonas sp. CNPSo 3701]MDD1508469.1 DTW domain-containing protein [Pseudomonas sp. CNPSo 3701]
MPRPRCSRCRRPASHCLCALIPDLPSRTEVLVLQHPTEVDHALNTANLAVLGLRSAALWVGEVFESLPEWVAEPSYRTCLLFPGEQARAISELPGDADPRPVRLIVPDGTWRKARKILYMNPLLAGLPRVTLADAPPSRYRLRKAPMEGSLSTLEAIVEALNVIEAPADYRALLKPFDALIEGQIAAMGEDTFRRNHQR